MKKFKKIAIIGVGLIGGSIGLAVRKRRLADEVIGIFRRSISLRKAAKAGAIDRAAMDFRRASDADLVIIATPVGKIAHMAKKAIPFMKKGSILIDVGSTKEELTKEIEKALQPGVSFVGTHPLAGSEKSGPSFAKADLFENSLCIVTRTKRTKPEALNRVKAFWQGIGAEVKVLPPREHDLHLARVSHLPHIVSCALMLSAEPSLSYAAAGFKDTTRISSSIPELWRDIFISNRANLLHALDSCIEILEKLRNAIKNKNQKMLLKELKRARFIRDRLG